jgi:hypothetical protein
MFACLRQALPILVRAPRTGWRASPLFSARGYGRTGLGSRPIFRDRQSRPLRMPVTGLIPCNPKPKEIAPCDDDDRHDHEKGDLTCLF